MSTLDVVDVTDETVMDGHRETGHYRMAWSPAERRKEISESIVL